MGGEEQGSRGSCGGETAGLVLKNPPEGENIERHHMEAGGNTAFILICRVHQRV